MSAASAADASAEQQIAQALRRAYESGPIEPFAARLGAAGLSAAYRVQEINTRFWLAQGRRLIGRKIGLTSEAVQRQLGVDSPDAGMLFDDMRLPDGGRAPIGRLLQPRIEAEVALCLRHDLQDPEMAEADLVAAVEWLAPALEIVDSRVRDWRISVVDTVADNASSGLFVLGEARGAPAHVDVVGCRMELHANGELASTGVGSACLGSPYRAAAWLARTMARIGWPLRAGDIVLTGALGPMVAVAADVAYEARIDGLGAVRIAF